MQLEPVALRSSPRNTERLVKSGMELEPVTLRSSPRINEPRKTESSGAKIETVRLRKVAADQKATKDDPAKSRSNGRKDSPVFFTSTNDIFRGSVERLGFKCHGLKRTVSGRRLSGI